VLGPLGLNRVLSGVRMEGSTCFDCFELPRLPMWRDRTWGCRAALHRHNPFVCAMCAKCVAELREERHEWHEVSAADRVCSVTEVVVR